MKKCCVIYNGQPTKIDSIDYLNAEKFLMTVHEMELSKKCGLAKFVSAKRNRRNQKAGCENQVRKQEKKSSIHLTRYVYKIQ